jgi:predicted transcriptional regulator
VERTSEAVTAASLCVSEENTLKWFDDLQEYMRENNLEVMNDPSRIFNGDETGFQI